MTQKLGKKAQAKANQEAALQLLRDPQFLYRLGQKLHEMGVVGEEKNCLTLFLATVTRSLDHPISVLIKGPTSSGKNNAVRNVVSLLPPECVITRSSLTKKALAYGTEDLSGKVIYLFEYQGGKDAQYMTREIQSEGSLQHEHTVVSGGGRSTQIAMRIGEPVFLSTTTADRVYADDETRFLSLRADESEDLTRKVLRAKFQPTQPKVGQPGIEIWQEAIRLLASDPRAFHYPDWFGFVADKIPAGEPRSRRDAERFISLLKAVAHCKSFSDGRHDRKGAIEIELADYCIAYELLSEGFNFTYSGAHPHALKVAETVRKLHADMKRPVTVKEVADHNAWEQALAYKWVNAAIQNKLVVREAGTQQNNLKRLIPGVDTEKHFLPHPTLVLTEGQDDVQRVTFINPLTGKPITLQRKTKDEDF